MRKSFDYMYTEAALDNISIDDIGNCYIKAINDAALEWYIQVETSTGFTNIVQFGPVKIGETELTNYGFNYNYQHIEYSEGKISSIIDKFINDSRRMITQVIEIDEEEFKDRLRGIIDEAYS